MKRIIKINLKISEQITVILLFLKQLLVDINSIRRCNFRGLFLSYVSTFSFVIMSNISTIIFEAPCLRPEFEKVLTIPRLRR